MRIGYSFWGFLGSGVVDTPDGGRGHRRVFIDGILATTGASRMIFLQSNRDLLEAGCDLRANYDWEAGLPPLDFLILEWRWPIDGRNTTDCGTAGHTCDLHRQTELIRHYTLRLRTPTLVWDKDLQLSASDPLRRDPAVFVCEAALHPSPGALELLFPVADAATESADPTALAAQPRPTQLAYVGNQYDRDEAFARFFAPAAAEVRHLVAGKWPRTEAWAHVNFTGRCSFDAVKGIYGGALATLLLVPDRYARVGQMTQRIFEAVLNGCLPLTPSTIRDAIVFTPAQLHVRDGADALRVVRQIDRIAGTEAHARLIESCIRRLAPFHLSRQLTVLREILDAAGLT